MRRFFAEDLDEGSKWIEIRGTEFIHIKKALRLEKGAVVVLFNGRGLELAGIIGSINKDSAAVEITGPTATVRESPFEIVLLQGLVKGDKPELIVEKATELGVKEVSFYVTSRTVPLISPVKSADRLSRWQRVAIEAAKQSGRTVLPRINHPRDFRSVLALYEDHLKIILWEGESTTGIKEALRGATGFKGAALLVGPEGGFTVEEVEDARLSGFIPSSLGPRVVRAETAAIAAASIIQYELGDLGGAAPPVPPRE